VEVFPLWLSKITQSVGQGGGQKKQNGGGTSGPSSQ
jgi:hypothetical protein